MIFFAIWVILKLNKLLCDSPTQYLVPNIANFHSKQKSCLGEMEKVFPWRVIRSPKPTSLTIINFFCIGEDP